jgi:hypothetical protein
MTKAPVQQYGITVTLPRGWEAVIFRRAPAPGEVSHPVVHAANFVLPRIRGDYGSGAVNLMTSGDVFVSLVEFHPSSAATPLFARHPRPQTLTTADFSPNSLQQWIAGQAGVQRFFAENGRAFCLYVVAGSHPQPAAAMATANQLIQALQIVKSAG